jgi:hypothetical protein
VRGRREPFCHLFITGREHIFFSLTRRKLPCSLHSFRANCLFSFLRSLCDTVLRKKDKTEGCYVCVYKAFPYNTTQRNSQIYTTHWILFVPLVLLKKRSSPQHLVVLFTQCTIYIYIQHLVVLFTQCTIYIYPTLSSPLHTVHNIYIYIQHLVVLFTQWTLSSPLHTVHNIYIYPTLSSPLHTVHNIYIYISKAQNNKLIVMLL